MMQITEDTPPDMLAGAMDLTVHLPNGKSVKMAVQRSTPMMDLLVQITTNHQLQLSNYILQALDMAPSSDRLEKVLPYKPSTPIGALDTQHIKVVPKARNSNGSSGSGTNVPKNVAPGQQPFESTFRLKVHLPRNQLYVTRVSRNVLLEDIMRKVCEEKNLDVHKYEFKHPANLDTVLDPKLTLSDYQITEIYLVTKGTFTQSFSSNDIMALRKEEERKQMHNKTGGGVFNLIFRRNGAGSGNTAANPTSGSGSLSSENRSISPTHSDDSRSVTPPVVEPSIQERPKPPQRKRRPAPKPPSNNRQADQQTSNANVSVPVTQPAVERVSNVKETSNNGLTICHSRNSSDSSGYHEAASILSDHCNTSLPRQRPKSMAFLSGGSHSGAPGGSNQNLHHISKGESQEKLNRFSSMSNLTQMTGHSKSTSSLVPPGRKKKAAPPPPARVPVKTPTTAPSSSDSVTTDSSATITPTPTVVASPIVARIASQNKTESETVESTTSPPAETTATSSHQDSPLISKNYQVNNNNLTNPKPAPRRNKNITAPVPRPRSQISDETSQKQQISNSAVYKDSTISTDKTNQSKKLDEVSSQLIEHEIPILKEKNISSKETAVNNTENVKNKIPNEKPSEIENSKIVEEKHTLLQDLNKKEVTQPKNVATDFQVLQQLQQSTQENIFQSKEFLGSETSKPEIVGVVKKSSSNPNLLEGMSKYDSLSRKRCFKIGSSLIDLNDMTQMQQTEKKKVVNEHDEINDLDENLFLSLPTTFSSNENRIFNQLFGIHDLEHDFKKDFNDGHLQNIETVKDEENKSSIKDEPKEVVETRKLKKGETDKEFIDYIDTVSLRSADSILDDDLLSEKSKLSKWYNLAEDLDEISDNNMLAYNDKWLVMGGIGANNNYSDSESIDTSIDVSATLKRQSIETPCSKQNTDTHLADYEKNENLRKTEDVVDSKANSTQLKQTENSVLKNIEDQQISKVDILNKDLVNTDKIQNHSDVVNATQTELNVTKKQSSNQITEENSAVIVEKCLSELKPLENNEIDWQYQLPSPPKAFKDSSPFNEPEDHFDRATKDSIVTSPELFEKLKELKELERESVGSVKSDESGTNILNKLSLENLEKRKSLVYNRELATSLKISEDEDSKINKKNTTDMEKFTDFDSSISKFEMTFNEVKNTNFTKNKTSTLPNFKITTYDNPKQKIKVFEDESIRSSENSQIRKTENVLNRHEFGRSMENISRTFASNDSDYYFYKPPINRSKGPSLSYVTRSGSFIDQNNQINNWDKSAESQPKSPTKPVVRSRSSLTTNSYTSTRNKMQTEEMIDRQSCHFETSNLSKSNSLFDVSGLQSLEVMKMIQTKLNTPTTSMENLNQSSSSDNKKNVIPKTTASKLENSYQNQITSINMGTWSDRQSQVTTSPHMKEHSDLNSCKLIVKTVNNSYEMQNTKKHKTSTGGAGGGVTVKINNNDNAPLQEHQVGGNVVIKIGQNNQNSNISHNYINVDHTNNKIEKKAPELKSFITHTTASGYRKPFTDVNKNNQQNFENIENNFKTSNRRPHSIAVDGNADISRVPIVRAVELKKPYRDLPTYNRSITQILGIPFSGDLDKEFNSKSASSANNTLNNKWNVGPSSYSTLPNRNSMPHNYATNKDVPFSQSTLRRTESSKLLHNDASLQPSVDKQPKSLNIDNSNRWKVEHKRVQNECKTINTEPKPISNMKDDTKSNKRIMSMTTPPPPPPIMTSNKNGRPINTCNYNEDPREALLSAIRNFGGKKGLKNVN